MEEGQRRGNRRMHRRLPYLCAALKGLLIGGLVAYVFYQDMWGLLWLPGLVCVSLFREGQVQRRKEREREQQQFFDYLTFLGEAMQAGFSMEQAIGEARKSLLSMYSEEEPFLQALLRMQQQLQLSMPVEQAFQRLSLECHCEEIGDFAEVLYLAKRTGGMVGQAITNTERILSRKQDTVKHIRSVLYSRLYETRIMKCIPFAMLLYLQLCMPGFLAPLYHNLFGVVLMTVVMLSYFGLCLLVDRIVRIVEG